MENASKALIIAGAILISILLIAVSMYIYNSSQDTISAAGNSMNQQAKDAYNSKFTSYMGHAKNANDVKALIDNVISSNNENVDQAGKFVQIKTNVDWTPASGTTNKLGAAGTGDNSEDYVNDVAKNLSALKSKISGSKKYDVENDMTAGIITTITITETGNTATPN